MVTQLQTLSTTVCRNWGCSSFCSPLFSFAFPFWSGHSPLYSWLWKQQKLYINPSSNGLKYKPTSGCSVVNNLPLKACNQHPIEKTSEPGTRPQPHPWDDPLPPASSSIPKKKRHNPKNRTTTSWIFPIFFWTWVFPWVFPPQPGQPLIFANGPNDLEEARGGRGAGERSTQRLGEGAQLHVSVGDQAFDVNLQGFRIPVSLVLPDGSF